MSPPKGQPWSAARRAACTDEYRSRLSAAKKRAVPWNKGLTDGSINKIQAEEWEQEQRDKQNARRRENRRKKREATIRAVKI